MILSFWSKISRFSMAAIGFTPVPTKSLTFTIEQLKTKISYWVNVCWICEIVVLFKLFRPLYNNRSSERNDPSAEAKNIQINQPWYDIFCSNFLFHTLVLFSLSASVCSCSLFVRFLLLYTCNTTGN
jgi:hypothetical protein